MSSSSPTAYTGQSICDPANYRSKILGLGSNSSISVVCVILLVLLPVVPHKAVAEVSKIGSYRRGCLL